MQWEKALSQGAVLVPLAHLFVCFLYLCGYSAGFGSNISAFFVASDILATATQSLFKVYLMGLALPLALLFYMHTSNSIPLVGTLDAAGNPEGYRKTVSRMERWFAPVGLGVFQAVVTVEIIWALSAWYFDSFFPYSILQTILVIIYFKYFFDWINKLSASDFLKGVIWLSVALPLAALVGGLSAGQLDRREGYVNLAPKSARCGSLIVRRRIGDLFIAVNQGEERMLITAECEPRIFFPARPRFTTPKEDSVWWGERRQRVLSWIYRWL